MGGRPGGTDPLGHREHRGRDYSTEGRAGCHHHHHRSERSLTSRTTPEHLRMAEQVIREVLKRRGRTVKMRRVRKE